MRVPSLVSRATFATALTIALLAGSAERLFAQGQSKNVKGASAVPRLRGEEPRMPPEARFQPEPPPTGDYRIDALLSGTSWPLTTITYSFYSDAVFKGWYDGPEAVGEVSERVKANVRAIMAWYSSVLGVSFVEVAESSSAVGLIRVMRSSGPAYAYAYYPAATAMFSVAGDVHLSPGYDRQGNTNGFQHPAGENGYLALVHEIGHAIGLKHPQTGSVMLRSAEDNDAHTVMSQNVLGEAPGTLMPYDLLALQHLYGARASRTNNDTYVATRAAADQYKVGDQLAISPSAPTKLTLWDTGGYNTLDLSAVSADSSGYRVDLRPLGWISAAAAYRTSYFLAGLSLGPGVSIRKVVNSSSNDTIYANGDANVFAGYAATRVTGHDVIWGADAADTIDLSGYAPAQVTERPSVPDLVLDFGTNGSLTLKDYYTGPSVPAIAYDAVVPTVSIGDVSVMEDRGGTAPATFVVALSATSATRQSVSWSTVAGTATAGTDFLAASGTLVFAPGETQKTVTVRVVGDTAEELDETFSVLLSRASNGLAIADGQGNATIVNDDVTARGPAMPQASTTPKSEVTPSVVGFVSAAPAATGAKPSRTPVDGASPSVANVPKTDTNAGASAPTRAANATKGTTAPQAATPPAPAVKLPQATQAGPNVSPSDSDARAASPSRTSGDGALSTAANAAATDPGAAALTPTRVANTAEAAIPAQAAAIPALAAKPSPAVPSGTTPPVETADMPTGSSNAASSDPEANVAPAASTMNHEGLAGAATSWQHEAGAGSLTPAQTVTGDDGASASEPSTSSVPLEDQPAGARASTTPSPETLAMEAGSSIAELPDRNGSIAAPASTMGDGASDGAAANPSHAEAAESPAPTQTVPPDASAATRTGTEDQGAAAAQAVRTAVEEMSEAALQSANELPVFDTGALPTRDEIPASVATSSAESAGPDGSLPAALPTIARDMFAGDAHAILPVAGERALPPAIPVFVSYGRVRAVKSQSGAYALADLTVTDANNRPVAGARVTVRWSGLVSRTNTGTTDANGRVSIVSRSTTRTGKIKMTVRSVAKNGCAYEPSRDSVRNTSAEVRK